jgi:hypothetical protein
MSWGKRTIQGTEYTFHHLEPFTFIADGLRVRVSLGAHAFTRALKAGDAPELLFMDGKTPRTFCSTRYGHSLHLPAAIMNAASGYVYNNQAKCILRGKLPGLSGPYVVAFEMRKSGTPKYDIKIQVVSAYHRHNVANMPRCTFSDAAAAILCGDAIIWIKK